MGMPVLDAFELSGRVAVVTGGNRGLGRAFARALGEAGARVAILARDTAQTDEVLRDLRASGWTAARVIGRALALAGVIDPERTIAASEVADLFRREALAPESH